MSISIQNLTVQYPYDKYPIIENLNLCINNKLTTLLIDTQSGKSTLAKAILGLVKYKGDIKVDDELYNQKTLQSRQIVYLTYPMLLFDNKTVRYNIEYPLRIRKVNKSERSQIVDRVANRLNLANELDVKVKKLDQATKSNVLVARAMTRPLKVIIIDDCIQYLSEHAQEILLQYATEQDAYIVNLTSNIERTVGEIILIQHNEVLAVGDKEQVAPVKASLLWINDNGG